MAVTAMNIQAAAREREERLQLVEYELRLAKEDLGVMNKRLAQQQQQHENLVRGLSFSTKHPKTS